MPAGAGDVFGSPLQIGKQTFAGATPGTGNSGKHNKTGRERDGAGAGRRYAAHRPKNNKVDTCSSGDNFRSTAGR